MDEESGEDDGLTAILPAPKVRRLDWQQCLCHGTTTGKSEKLTKFQSQSWLALHNAASVRLDETHAFLRKEGVTCEDEPRGVYHRSCYQNYTNKTNITRLQKKREKMQEEASSATPVVQSSAVPTEAQGCIPVAPQPLSSERSTRTRTSLQQTDFKLCILCQKKKMQSKYTAESLSRCEMDSAVSSLVEAARIRDDARVLLATENGQLDFFAAEVCYHRSCYMSYTSKANLSSVVKKRSQCLWDGNAESERCAADKALCKLVGFVEQRIVSESHIISMAQLERKFRQYLNEFGADSEYAFRRDKLKRKLESYFEQRIDFWKLKASCKSKLVFSSAITKGQLLESCMTLLDRDDEDIEYEDLAFDGDERNSPHLDEAADILHSALNVRAAVMRVKNKLPWPPQPEQLAHADDMVPALLYNCIALILIGAEKCDFSLHDANERIRTEDDIHRRIVSISQDIVYAAHGGRVPTPKHILLPSAVHHLTRSAQIVTMLNRFGHGVSLSYVQEMNTTLADVQLKLSRIGDVPLPSAIDHSSSVVLATDNNDILEDTPTGANTTHCTNSILIQRVIPSVVTEHHSALARQQITVKRGHKRSLQGIANEPPRSHVVSKRCGPGTYDLHLPALSDISDVSVHASTLDFVWSLIRLPASVTEHIGCTASTTPAWSGFNAALLQTQDDPPPSSRVGYLPVINSPSTQLSTCKVVLDNAVNIAKQLEQGDIVVVADQAIYAKLQEILWQDQTLNDQAMYSAIVPRMGTFHVICVLLAVIGRRFGDAGLRDVLVEGNVISSGSVSAALEGRHYNRAVRAHLVVAEVFEHLRWRSFEEWFSRSDITISFEAMKEALDSVRNDLSMEAVTKLISHPVFGDVQKKYVEFCSSAHGPMFSFWTSYLELVGLLRCFLRATREGNWSLHLECVRELLPWLFAYDRTNYCRYLSAYWCEMKCLPSTHPIANAQMERGEFAVQRSGRYFSQVPVDQCLEQTINRDTKVSGGIIGISMNASAVQRWVLTSHIRAELTRCCKDAAGMAPHDDAHKALQSVGISASINLLRDVHLLLGSLSNPFADSECVFNIASGVRASEEVQRDLLGALEKGLAACEQFFRLRLLSKNEDFHQKLPQLKLKTFSTQLKKRQPSVTGRQSIVQSHCNLFARLAVAAQTRNFDMKAVISYELGVLPYSLATVDGCLVKTAKSKLLPLLLKDAELLPALPVHDAIVVDAMAVLQSTVPLGDTFGSLAKQLLSSFLHSVQPGSRLDFVSDQYPTNSIKSLERNKRARSGTLLVHISGPNTKLPSWKKFMLESTNKVELINFLASTWRAPEYAPYLLDKKLVMNIGDRCVQLSSNDGVSVQRTEVPELQSNQEEADTRMLLHACHATSSGAESVVIRSPDTDVVVIGLWAANQLQCRLVMDIGSGSHRKVFSLTSLAQSLGLAVCNALPGYHAFTGCDSTSSFTRRGKSASFKLVLGGEASAMTSLGSTLEPEDQLLRSCEKFVCRMYGKESYSTVNDLRYHLFCTSALKSYADLPPTDDALLQHVKRSNFQAYLWKHCLSSGQVPSPHGHGWKIDGDVLSIIWQTRAPAPSALLELAHCGCSTGCSSGRCSCVKSKLPDVGLCDILCMIFVRFIVVTFHTCCAIYHP